MARPLRVFIISNLLKDLALMISVTTLVDIICTHLSTQKMLEQDEHGVTLLLYYLHVKCTVHLSWIFAGKCMPISGDMT